MPALLRLAPRRVTQDEVLRAWDVYRSMILAEVNDPALLDDLTHQQARAEAFEKYQRLYTEWDAQE